MKQKLNLDTWNRKEHFLFFKQMEEPFFGLTTKIECTKAYQKAKKETDPTHYFKMMKELTLLGFFTSEIGATKALRYVAVPGKYEGCIPYNKGDKAWAT